MSLIDMLVQAQGGGGVDAISKQFGLTPSQTQQAIAALAPALATGIKRNTASPDGLSGMLAALSSGNHAKYHDDVSNALTPEGIADGNGVLGHVLGSKDVSRAVAAHASQSTGISSSILKQMLPVIASMVMGGLFKQSSNTQSGGAGGGILGQVLGQVINQQSSGGSNPLGSILGGLLGGGSSQSASGSNPLSDILGGLLGGGQQAAPSSQTQNQAPSHNDIFGDLLNTGPEPEANYQSSVDSIFDQFLDGMQRRS